MYCSVSQQGSIKSGQYTPRIDVFCLFEPTTSFNRNRTWCNNLNIGVKHSHLLLLLPIVRAARAALWSPGGILSFIPGFFMLMGIWIW